MRLRLDLGDEVPRDQIGMNPDDLLMLTEITGWSAHIDRSYEYMRDSFLFTYGGPDPPLSIPEQADIIEVDSYRVGGDYIAEGLRTIHHIVYTLAVAGTPILANTLTECLTRYIRYKDSGDKMPEALVEIPKPKRKRTRIIKLGDIL